MNANLRYIGPKQLPGADKRNSFSAYLQACAE